MRDDGALLPGRRARGALVPAGVRRLLSLGAAAAGGGGATRAHRRIGRRDRAAAAEAWAGFAAPDADLRALAPTVSCPVLFTWAVRDRFIQLRRNLPAIRTFPNARVVELRAGHAPQLEMPEAFEREVAQLLAALPS